jgi:DNA-binding transcriptional LysR family regulator
MRFTLAQLEAFHWIAKLGTVRDAARHLNLAQPTVSLRLRDLETALGALLFERLGRALRLTDEGLVLL